VGDDVEEAQEFAVEASAGGDDARQEGVFESGISGPVAVHLWCERCARGSCWAARRGGPRFGSRQPDDLHRIRGYTYVHNSHIHPQFIHT
jgi:hypothetical protein